MFFLLIEIFYSSVILVIGLIHLSEKYLIETLRNECKKYVSTCLNDLELINFDEKKEFIPRHILYKDGTQKHITSEIGINKIAGRHWIQIRDCHAL